MATAQACTWNGVASLEKSAGNGPPVATTSATVPPRFRMDTMAL